MSVSMEVYNKLKTEHDKLKAEHDNLKADSTAAEESWNREKQHLLQQLGEQRNRQMIVKSGLDSTIKAAEKVRATKGKKRDDKNDPQRLLEKKLGVGATANVYEVHNSLTGGTTALKVMTVTAKGPEELEEKLEDMLKEPKMHQKALDACPDGVVMLLETFVVDQQGADLQALGQQLSQTSISASPSTPHQVMAPSQTGGSPAGASIGVATTSPLSYSSDKTHHKVMVALALEACRGGDLASHLEELNEKHKADPPNVYFCKATHLLADVAETVLKLDKAGVVHNDLQGMNVLVTKAIDDNDYDHVQTKVGDFGIFGDEDVDRSMFNGMLQGLGFIFFEIVNEFLSADDDQHCEWEKEMHKLKIAQALPESWNAGLREEARFTPELAKYVCGTILKATAENNVTAIGFEGFKRNVNAILASLGKAN